MENRIHDKDPLPSTFYFLTAFGLNDISELHLADVIELVQVLQAALAKKERYAANITISDKYREVLLDLSKLCSRVKQLEMYIKDLT